MGRNLTVFVGLFPLPVNSEWTAGQQSTWLNCGWTLAAIQAAGISSPTSTGEGEIWIKAPSSFSSSGSHKQVCYFLNFFSKPQRLAPEDSLLLPRWGSKNVLKTPRMNANLPWVYSWGHLPSYVHYPTSTSTVANSYIEKKKQKKKDAHLRDPWGSDHTLIW